MRVGKDLEEDVNAHFKAVVWILSQQSKKNNNIHKSLAIRSGYAIEGLV